MPDPERAEQRMNALRRLQSLQMELERLHASGAPGEDVLIWPGYRDVLHELLAALGRAGEDIAPFTTERGVRVAKNRVGRRDHQRISLDRLLADVIRVREHVGDGVDQPDDMNGGGEGGAR